MPRYDHNGIAFDTPEDWIDRTIVAFGAPVEKPGSPNAPNIVMTQEMMRDGDTLRMQADRQLMDLAKHLHDFDILESRQTTVGGLPAIHMRFSWVSQLGGLEQSYTLVERAVAAGRMVVVFTGTVRTEDAAKLRPVFSKVLESVRFSPVGAPPMAHAAAANASNPSSSEPVIPMPGTRRDHR
jgi:hypothetical protein